MAVGTDASATLTAFPSCYTRAGLRLLGEAERYPIGDVRFLGEGGHSTADFAVMYNTAVTSGRLIEAAVTDKYCTLPQTVATRNNAATIMGQQRLTAARMTSQDRSD